MGTKFGSDASLFLQASENWCHVTHCVRAFLRRVRLWLVAPGGGDAKNEACPLRQNRPRARFPQEVSFHNSSFPILSKILAMIILLNR